MGDTVLLVDNSYNAFYRINATMTWFKLSHPEIDTESESFVWEENEDFLKKLDKMYLSSLNKIINKHNIVKDNINKEWINFFLSKKITKASENIKMIKNSPLKNNVRALVTIKKNNGFK